MRLYQIRRLRIFAGALAVIFGLSNGAVLAGERNADQLAAQQLSNFVVLSQQLIIFGGLTYALNDIDVNGRCQGGCGVNTASGDEYHHSGGIHGGVRYGTGVTGFDGINPIFFQAMLIYNVLNVTQTFGLQGDWHPPAGGDVFYRIRQRWAAFIALGTVLGACHNGVVDAAAGVRISREDRQVRVEEAGVRSTYNMKKTEYYPQVEVGFSRDDMRVSLSAYYDNGYSWRGASQNFGFNYSFERDESVGLGVQITHRLGAN